MLLHKEVVNIPSTAFVSDIQENLNFQLSHLTWLWILFPHFAFIKAPPTPTPECYLHILYFYSI